MKYLKKIGETLLIGVCVSLVVFVVWGFVYYWNDEEFWVPLESFWEISTPTPAPTPTANVMRIEVIIMTPTPGDGG